MKPITREEQFMAAAAQGKTDLTPITRQENFLRKIAEAVGGGGSGGAGGNSEIVVVKITPTDILKGVSNMSASEIMAEVQSGKLVVATGSGALFTFSTRQSNMYGQPVFCNYDVKDETPITTLAAVMEDKTVQLMELPTTAT